MTVVFYTYYSENVSNVFFEKSISYLPRSQAEEINKFRYLKDALASLYGKLLLKEGLIRFGCTASLHDIRYNKFKKPYFKDNLLCFNISHSGNYVVCAISNEVESLGVDIEKIQNVNIYDFQMVWNKNEWELILKNDIKLFYELWTRKEAVIKADGRGMELQLESIDVSYPEVKLENKIFFLKTLQIHSDYVLNLASVKKFDEVDSYFLSFN